MARGTPAADTTSLACSIVESVADACGNDPLELEPRLYDVVDPDALERLFACRPDGSPRPGGRVEFVLAGCAVCVRSDRSVQVNPLG